jgi:hypothetical protein
MNSSTRPTSIRNATTDSVATVEAWRRSQAALDAERLRRLRSLSERDSARLFAQLLQIHGPYQLRPSSGLVEQQRLLARLHEHA